MQEKKIFIICIIFIVLSIGIYFSVNYLLNADLKKQEQELEDTIKKYGYVEKESVSIAIAKFNTEVMANGINFPANEDYLLIDESNNLYWYGLYDDIYCYIKPLNFTKNKDDDIAEITAIYYDKNTKNEEMVIKYVKSLLKASNENLSVDDINYLINEAKKLSPTKNTSNNGKGIFVGYLEESDHNEYQIIRNYK